MKTSLEIEDGLFLKAKELAARKSTTVRRLVERGLRQVLAEEDAKHGAEPYRLEDLSVTGKGLQSGLDPENWQQIRAMAYGYPVQDQ